ncbi:alanine--tRNA ligase [Candidatus Schneideria nysicola]|uniref:alanine--tRNA ligase n=1 Tax=Candidatus Schneideria nysicola TaxID=1081631 RepID=UPI001CAA6AD4|nr:alanine--tRNA ligase [Candidatus Schneideria nysicola]UAJ65104.1 alanine--tRNA ligase [Candidatus Schneideria nysicola]
MKNNISEIRQTFLKFFKNKNHTILKSSSLIPADNDPTVLIVNAGMNQFKEIFLGLQSPPYQQVATAQRCVRAGGKHNDLSNVGYTTRHHTFFEMLGNFSFGSYFKKKAIELAWELLTSSDWFNIPKERLLVTVYAYDKESYNIWINNIGLPKNRVIQIGNKKELYHSDNFWKMGDTGPCGPSSEIFYDRGDHLLGTLPGSSEDQESGDRYIEIWNLVFMQFNRKLDGTMISLPNPTVDTGMGLERIASVLQNVDSNYEIDLFRQLIIEVAKIINVSDLHNRSLYVIADHIRSCVFLIFDGLFPSNEGRGYILRRIIRRAIIYGNLLGNNNIFFYKIVKPLIDLMGDHEIVHSLAQKQNIIEDILYNEEKNFHHTLKNGLILLNHEMEKLDSNILSGARAFYLYDTHGLPLDLIIEICNQKNIQVNTQEFYYQMELQRQRSQQLYFVKNAKYAFLSMDKPTSFLGYDHIHTKGQVIALIKDNKLVQILNEGEEAIVLLDQTPFYAESGGQIGDKGKIIVQKEIGIFNVYDTKKYGHIFYHFGKMNKGILKLGDQVEAIVDKNIRICTSVNHSATHLLHAILRIVLGKHIKQKGSLVTDQYLRFDFYHSDAMEREQIRQVEFLFNQHIWSNLPISTEIMDLDRAKSTGAISSSSFEKKYYQISEVRVLNIGVLSKEICAGTHAKNTSEIGLFYITAEYSIAANTRRIEAITREVALNSIQNKCSLISNLNIVLKSSDKNIMERIFSLQKQVCSLEKDIKFFKLKYASQKSELLVDKLRKIQGIPIIVSQLEDNIDKETLHIILNILKQKLQSVVIVLSTILNDKIHLFVSVTNDLTNRINAVNIIQYLLKKIEGKGGGNKNFAQGIGKNISTFPSILESLFQTILN